MQSVDIGKPHATPIVSRCSKGGGLGSHLFSFAVVADSHLEPEFAGASAPRSNARNRSVVDGLATLAPRFVVHLGDIVHPVPDAPEHAGTLSLAERLFSGLHAPVLYTPGNHDVGDKKDPTAPAKLVTDAWLQEYVRVFGAPYHARSWGDVLLVLLNSPILGSGLAVESAQRQWLQQTLKQWHGRRVFIATHYPPYLEQPGEPVSYDNIDTQARLWLLDLLRKHRVEAMFCGHVHNPFYNRFEGTEIYALPSTSFARRDYSEMHRSAPLPGDEFGRNDTAALGYYWVDVHQDGHVARMIETDGVITPAAPRLPGHPKDPGEVPLGLSLAHPWCERVELPFNPPVDAFARRVVRNDHPVHRLWAMGVRSLRVPVGDLVDDRIRQRVEEMAYLGLRFTFFSVGLPDQGLLDVLARHASLVFRWECVLPIPLAPELAHRAFPLVRDHGIRLLLANLRSGAAGNTRKTPEKHYAAPGFATDEIDAARAVLKGDLAGVAAGLCFGLTRKQPLEPALQALTQLAETDQAIVVATCTLMGDGPNDSEIDDDRNRALVQEVLDAALRHPRVELQLDTFIDIDRGYFVRNGLLDRRSHWRAAGRLLVAARSAQIHRPPVSR